MPNPGMPGVGGPRPGMGAPGFRPLGPSGPMMRPRMMPGAPMFRPPAAS